MRLYEFDLFMNKYLVSNYCTNINFKSFSCWNYSLIFYFIWIKLILYLLCLLLVKILILNLSRNFNILLLISTNSTFLFYQLFKLLLRSFDFCGSDCYDFLITRQLIQLSVKFKFGVLVLLPDQNSAERDCPYPILGLDKAIIS